MKYTLRKDKVKGFLENLLFPLAVCFIVIAYIPLAICSFTGKCIEMWEKENK